MTELDQQYQSALKFHRQLACAYAAVADAQDLDTLCRVVEPQIPPELEGLNWMEGYVRNYRVKMAERLVGFIDGQVARALTTRTPWALLDEPLAKGMYALRILDMPAYLSYTAQFVRIVNQA